MSGNDNPGNFANRPKVGGSCFYPSCFPLTTLQEEVQNIAQKGGASSHSGGFASMDPEKQVSPNVSGGDDNSRIDLLKRKTLRPWVGRPPADHSRRAVRQPGKLVVRED